jgi:hypothetical protein
MIVYTKPPSPSDARLHARYGMGHMLCEHYCTTIIHTVEDTT